MTNANQQFVAASQANVETFEHIAGTALAGVEQLSHLNLAVAKAVFAESFDHVQSLLNVRDPQQLIALQSGVIQPAAEKAVSYGRQVYEIVNNTGTEIAKAVEVKMSESQQQFAAAVENAAKNAPVGSETAVALFKSAFSASQDAIQSAQKAAKQAVETAESNVSSMTDRAVSTTKAAAKKR